MANKSGRVFDKFKIDFFKIVRESQSKKLVIISDSEILKWTNSIQNFEEKSVKLSDLTQKFVTDLLLRQLKFQDETVEFRKIISVDSYHEISVQKMLICKTLGDSVVNPDAFDRNIYINRTLKNVLIRKSIMHEESIRSKNIFVLKEDDFKDKCEKKSKNECPLS
jgi:hypothetical protein